MFEEERAAAASKALSYCLISILLLSQPATPPLLLLLYLLTSCEHVSVLTHASRLVNGRQPPLCLLCIGIVIVLFCHLATP